MFKNIIKYGLGAATVGSLLTAIPCLAAADATLVNDATLLAAGAKENAQGVAGELYLPVLIVGFAVALVYFALRFGRKVIGR